MYCIVSRSRQASDHVLYKFQLSLTKCSIFYGLDKSDIGIFAFPSSSLLLAVMVTQLIFMERLDCTV